ncbi:MAG: DNA gyrase inhibitor YacG [Caulobacter sp. 12-67-6]|nr:MAG: DNA gyrase inhibitor YacG [Caulobacter sp. 12-67-6]OYX71210.1 MAG: DNA gyrase inhibitor YacG [Caulobacter sp. 32-67-35]OYX92224.1 MAG: DNA gyrase inhibitor YacG [Caulobacter sp. 35-67-4]
MSIGCPICGKPVDPGFRPFCSKRCSDVDLQRWLSGRYVVPASDDEDENLSSEDIYRNDD